MIVGMMALLNGCDFTIIAAARSQIIASNAAASI
jgi:hypothetical protein